MFCCGNVPVDFTHITCHHNKSILCGIYCGLLVPRGPFYQHGLTYLSLSVIPAWISNCIHYKVWAELTYTFPNFNGATVEVWEWTSRFNPRCTGHVVTYPCWSKLNRVSKRDPRYKKNINIQNITKGAETNKICGISFALKPKSCYFAIFVIIGNTHKILSHPWRQIWHFNNFCGSMLWWQCKMES